MTQRAAAWLAWSTLVASVTFTAMGLWLLALTYTIPVGPRWGPRGLGGLATVVTGLIGALIASRHPRNPIGWLFCALGLVGSLQLAAEEYAVYAVLARPGQFPGGVLMAWLQNWLWAPGSVVQLAFVPLLFPDGRLPSRQWRPVAWLAGLATVALSLGVAFQPGRLGNFYPVVNPLGLPVDVPTYSLYGGSVWVLVFVAIMLSVASLVWRVRLSGPEVRQQLKWLMYAAILSGAGGVAGNLGGAGALVFIAATSTVPVAIGVAILRYRLYDIDLLIRRTLVYSALTGLLALAYFGSVLVLEGLVRLLTGQSQSQVVTVVSTLVIAALFVPLRRRVQAFIDRRFYRRKYDAARTLAAFSNSVRDEVELGRLAERLTEVVDETLQPESVTLWLKKPEPAVKP